MGDLTSALFQREITTAVGTMVTERSYGSLLDEMRVAGKTGITEEDPKKDLYRKALERAFWEHYCDAKLKQGAFASAEDGNPLFLNLLDLIRDPKAPKIELLVLDEIEDMLENASLMLRCACSMLFGSPGTEDGLEDTEEEEDDASGALTQTDTQKVLTWLAKILLSKDASTPQGRQILIGRLVQLSATLVESLGTSDETNRKLLKRAVENNLLGNADNCPDRAVSGLDDMEFDMQVFHAPKLEVAIHVLIRQYKKQVIKECLVAHEFAESAEEYIYLLLLLNDWFNLGAFSIGIHSAECGARKSFDIAARKLIDSLSIEGICHFLASNMSLRSFLSSQVEHTESMESAALEADKAEERLYAYVRSVVDPYIYKNFVIKEEKYQELSIEDVSTLQGLITP